MARIRTIKPEFWSSPDTAGCQDPWARLLFIAMWNWADDMGRGTANPKELAGFAFPNDEKIDSAEIRRMLGEIRRAFGVILYEVGGRPYYAIPSWDDHQKIDKRSGARWPAPEDGNPWEPDPDQGKRESSAEPAESTPRPRRTPGAGSRNRGTGEVTTSVSKLTRSDDRFDEFWSVWPRKVAKDGARRAWRSVLAKKVDPEVIIASTRAHAEHWRRTEQPTEYIPHPATWLRRGSYADDPAEAYPGRVKLRAVGFQPTVTPNGRILDF